MQETPTFSQHNMATLQIALIWFTMLFLPSLSESCATKDCFELRMTSYGNQSTLSWASAQGTVQLYLSCEDIPNGVISLGREVHSIPSNWSNRCAGCNFPTSQPLVADHSCVCCNDTNVKLCETDSIPKEDLNELCNGKKKCQVKVKRRDLESNCMGEIDYNCENKKTRVFRCYSRWVRITYECVQGSSNAMTSIVTQPFPKSLLIALVGAVCLLSVTIAVITTVFCWRHNRLKKKYFRDRRLVSSEGTDGEDAKQDHSVYYKAGPIEDTANIAHKSVGILQTDQNSNGIEQPLLNRPGSGKKRHTYENIKDGDSQEYTQVDKSLKQKNKSKDIDESNLWHDPDKESEGTWKVGNAIVDMGQKKDEHGEVELVENMYYEGGNPDQVDSNEKKKERRQKSTDTDYEEI